MMRNTKFILSFLLLLSFVSINNNLFPQFNSPNPTVPSSNIALGKENLEISNDLYNGKLNVSIPIYTYNFEGITFPINMSYSGGNGIKPDELPSWVGAGWNLQVGGYIHRTVRGKPDEVQDFDTEITTTTDLFGLHPPKLSKNTNLASDYSYLSNVNLLTDQSWSTQNFANAHPRGVPSLPLHWEANGYAIDRETYNPQPTTDLVPDEFSFSFCGFSGKFYINQTGNAIFSSNDGKKYEVSILTGEQTVVDLIIPQTGSRIYYKTPRIIKYISLTSSEGVKYSFGNSDLNAPFQNQYFDYSHSSEVNHLDGDDHPPFAELSGNVGATLVDIVPHTWHLSKIENIRTGSIITLDYKLGYQYYKTRQASGWGSFVVYNNSQIYYNVHSFDDDISISYYRLSALSKVLTRNWTLTAINFPNGTKIDFTSTQSTQLETNQPVQFSSNCYFSYEDFWYNIPGNLNNTLLKLDKISISYYNDLKKEFDFSYVLSNSQRLQLDKIKQRGGNNISNQYSFHYNNVIQLPAYGVGKSDHWGFFNNKDFFSSVAAPYDVSKLSLYSSYREPDSNFVQAEILTGINYPTGGSVVFEYQANQYSKTVNSTDFSVSNLNNNQFAGGVRIKKASYYQGNQSLYEKIYSYYQPGSSSVSSGVLNILPRQYLHTPSGNVDFKAEGFDPIYYDGNNVTYTYATEQQVNNGRLSYEFTNTDNGFNDELPFTTNVTRPIDLAYYATAYKHNAFKRGKPITIQTFNEAGTLIKEVDCHYEHENSETNKEELRSLYLSGYNSPVDFAAISEKIYSDILNSQETKDYSSSGVILTRQSTKYDSYGNIKESSFLNSNGEIIRSKYKYSFEFSSTGTDEISLGIKFANDLNLKNVLIEKIIYRENADGSNSNIIGASLFTYKTQSAFLDKTFSLQISQPLPASSFSEASISNASFIRDQHYSSSEDVHVDKYDARGNILQVTDRSGIIKSTLWGYGGMYPVAEIIGASYDNIISGLNQYLIENPYGAGASSLRAELNNIRVNFPVAQVTTSTYDPQVGMTSQTDPRGRVVYYIYDGFGRLESVRDNEQNIIKKYCYNYAGELANCGGSVGNTVKSGSFIKECSVGMGSVVTYTIPVNTYFSTDQNQADQLAQNDINTNGQQYANEHGTCTGTGHNIYARLEVTPSYSGNTSNYSSYYNATEQYYYQQVSIYLRFYSDATCTQPFALPNDVNYSINDQWYLETGSGYSYSSSTIYQGTASAGSTEVFFDNVLNFEYFWGFYNTEGNYVYYERAKDDYSVGSIDGGAILKPSVYPTHTLGF